MTLFSYFKLPDSICFGKKITKTAILADNKLSAGEKKILNEISSITIQAIVNSENYTILPFNSEIENYKEVLFIQVELKSKLEPEKVNSFVQNLIPRPIVLIVLFEEEFSFGMALRKINQIDKSKRIITEIESLSWTKLESQESFYTDLDTSNFSHQNLKAFYQSFIQRLQYFQISIFENTDYQSFDIQMLEIKRRRQKEKELLVIEVKKLQKQIKETDSFGQKVNLNLSIKKLQNKIY